MSLEMYAIIATAIATSIELLEIVMFALSPRVSVEQKTLPVLPKTGSPVPLVCPACSSLIDDNGRCKCPPYMADMHAKMQEARRIPKFPKYRSIDDDWNSEGGS